MTDVRCPKCAAHVAEGAPWCGQCYTSMVREPVKPPRPPLRADTALQVVNGGAAGSVALLGDVPPPPPPPPGTIPPPPAAPPGAATGAANRTLRLGKQPWPCVRCETVNPYEENVCKACGKGFLDALSEPGTRIPLIGPIDDLGRGSKIKIGVVVTLGLGLPLVIIFTVAGLIFH